MSVDWRGMSMVLAQLQKLNEPDSLELLETEYELKAIEDEKDRAFKSAQTQFDFYQKQHTDTINQIEAMENSITEISSQGMKLAPKDRSKDFSSIIQDNDVSYTHQLIGLNKDIETAIKEDMDYLQELTVLRNNMLYGKEIRTSLGAGTEFQHLSQNAVDAKLTAEEWNSWDDGQKKAWMDTYKNYQSHGNISGESYATTPMDGGKVTTNYRTEEKYKDRQTKTGLLYTDQITRSHDGVAGVRKRIFPDGRVEFIDATNYQVNIDDPNYVANLTPRTQEEMESAWLELSNVDYSINDKYISSKFKKEFEPDPFGHSRKDMTVDKLDWYFNNGLGGIQYRQDQWIGTGWDIDASGNVDHNEYEAALNGILDMMTMNGQDTSGISEGFWSGYNKEDVARVNLADASDRMSFHEQQIQLKTAEIDFAKIDPSPEAVAKRDRATAEKSFAAFNVYKDAGELVQKGGKINVKTGEWVYNQYNDAGISATVWKSAQEKAIKALEDVNPKHLASLAGNKNIEEYSTYDAGFSEELLNELKTFNKQWDAGDAVHNLNLQVGIIEQFNWVVNNWENYKEDRLSTSGGKYGDGTRGDFKRAVRYFEEYYPQFFESESIQEELRELLYGTID